MGFQSWNVTEHSTTSEFHPLILWKVKPEWRKKPRMRVYQYIMTWDVVRGGGQLPHPDTRWCSLHPYEPHESSAILLCTKNTLYCWIPQHMGLPFRYTLLIIMILLVYNKHSCRRLFNSSITVSSKWRKVSCPLESEYFSCITKM